MKVLIIDLNSRGLAHDEFVKPIGRILESEGVEWQSVNYMNVKPANLQLADKVILSGTPLMDFQYLENLDRFEWLKEFHKPVLGICAGMQVIALVFGSSLKSFKHIGMCKIHTAKKNSLANGEFEAYSLHGEAILPSPDFEVLAKSAHCAEIIKHNEEQFYGILFHPEVRNTEIVLNFVKE